MRGMLAVLAATTVSVLTPVTARADVPDDVFSVGFGGAAIQAFERNTSGHALWIVVEFGRNWWRLGGVVGTVYPGGRLQTLAAFYGLTGRGALMQLAPGLTLDASVLLGLVEPDVVAGPRRSPGGLPPESVRWASDRSLLVSPAVGLRWAPASSGVFLDVDGRLVNLSQFGLFFGAGLAF